MLELANIRKVFNQGQHNEYWALKGIDLEMIVFDRAAGTLTLRYESMILAHKNIEHAIIAAGFDANELTSTDEARRALPPECRGPAAETNAPAPGAP